MKGCFLVLIMSGFLIKNKITIAVVVIMVVVIGVIIYTNSAIRIGDYRVIITEEYKPIGKVLGGNEVLFRYDESDVMEEKSFSPPEFIERLEAKGYSLKNAVHHLYDDLEKEEKINSWTFILENDKSQSLHITTAPAIRNPVYLQEEYNPQEWIIKDNKVIIMQKGMNSTVFLHSYDENNEKYEGMQQHMILWIEGKNLSNEEALAVAEMFFE